MVLEPNPSPISNWFNSSCIATIQNSSVRAFFDFFWFNFRHKTRIGNNFVGSSGCDPLIKIPNNEFLRVTLLNSNGRILTCGVRVREGDSNSEFHKKVGFRLIAGKLISIDHLYLCF